MVKQKKIQERVDVDFANYVRKLYPLEKSFGEKTRKLNIILEEMLHGKTK